MRAFAPSADSGPCLALCSDALAEGLNLQGASAAVLLDMPSVIRLAEQRVGRIDRMDSRHRTIQVYWPEDSREYALRTDELFLDRHQHVAQLIGSNLELPAVFQASRAGAAETISPLEYARGLQQLAERGLLDGIADAFQPIRALIEGDSPLVPVEHYRHFRRSRARVLSCVGIVNAASEWALYAVAGSEREAPRWVFVDPTQQQVELDLETICNHLRGLLVPGADSYMVSELVMPRITSDLDLLKKHVRSLLPKRKQRALTELSAIMAAYAKDADGAAERLSVIRGIQRLIEDGDAEAPVDMDRLAEWWLETIRPLWYDHMLNRRRARPALLRDLRKPLRAKPLSTEQLKTIETVPLQGQPLHERVAAAIIGVVDTSDLRKLYGPTRPSSTPAAPGNQ